MVRQMALKSQCIRLWHVLDNVQWLNPLPPAHRRGIAAGALLIIIGVLLPGTSAVSPEQTPRDAQLSLPATEPATAHLASPADQLDAALPDTDPDNHSVSEGESTGFNPEGIEHQWRNYRLESGKTLAQLFRDNNLPPTDAYAMAKVEGADKPLSNLKSGQMIKVRQNANGIITGLAIEGSGKEVLFTRQANGRFIRVN